MEKKYKLPKLFVLLGIKKPITREQVLYENKNVIPTETVTSKIVQDKVVFSEGKPDDLENKNLIAVHHETFLANVLEKHYKKMRYYAKTGEYFLYNPENGLYNSLSPQEFTVLLTNLIMESPLKGYVDAVKYSDRVLHTLRGTDIAYIGQPELDHDFIILKNGCLNIKTKKFSTFSENVMQTSRADYEYDPSATCPMFLQFLKELSAGHEDRIRLLRA